MRRVRVLCGAVVACAAFELMGQAAPASPKLGETVQTLRVLDALRGETKMTSVRPTRQIMV
jgi:hypothetical protein